MAQYSVCWVSVAIAMANGLVYHYRAQSGEVIHDNGCLTLWDQCLFPRKLLNMAFQATGLSDIINDLKNTTDSACHS